MVFPQRKEQGFERNYLSLGHLESAMLSRYSYGSKNCFQGSFWPQICDITLWLSATSWPAPWILGACVVSRREDSAKKDQSRQLSLRDKQEGMLEIQLEI